METQFDSFIAVSRAIATLPGLPTLLGQPINYQRTVAYKQQCAAVLAWGRKPSARQAEQFAQQHGFPLLRLEDGFLRSVQTGQKESALSIVVDDLGIYYDASQPSRLEQLIVQPLSAAQLARAGALINAWRVARVSKYNYARELYPLPCLPYVLIIDQVRGDASITYGQADQHSFQAMLTAAKRAYPDCQLIIKTHPEVITGRKRGHFDLNALSQDKQIQVLAADVHPVALVEQAQALFCVTSQLGFEGLLWGKPVYTFGLAFYAGWGLTIDALTAPSRRLPVRLENLVYAALIAYPRYLDPETQCRCEVEQLISWLGLQRQMRERFPEKLVAIGFSWHKKPIVRRFFQGSEVVFKPKLPAIIEKDKTALLVWQRPTFKNETAGHVLGLEDGFIRSVGLGAELAAPLSWAIDTRGIYYDSTSVSDLEHILQHTDFTAELLARAEHLRNRLVAEGVTKYNVGAGQWLRERSCEAGQTRVILVPGQVESDASLRFGAPVLAKNSDVLQAVRLANPDAYVLYKPHPDVVAGLRKQGKNEAQAQHWCNEVLSDVVMGHLLTQVDEVHTLTSLTGFEALLRGKKVVCYGQPFYSGWGLTDDQVYLARRTRTLNINALVAGVLILYPIYLSRSTGRYTTPERALDELIAWQHEVKLPRWCQYIFRYVLTLEKKLTRNAR
ncbi:MAG: hypothetical protein K9K84_07685 [Methylovulum sp.]|nr:hypothetical protein [Methylovulum sp.]